RCVAEGVSLLPGAKRDGGDPRPVITIQRLIIQSNFIALFTRRIELVRADGLYVRVPSLKSKPTLRNNGNLTLREFVANSAVIEFENRRQGRGPLRFEIHESRFVLRGDKGTISFNAALLNPEPPGEVRVNGRLGPWRSDNLSQ